MIKIYFDFLVQHDPFEEDNILSLSLIDPDLIFSNPAIVLRIVVLPTPDRS